MKIAVTYENGQVFQHFGHTAQFKIYEAQEGRVLSSQVVDTNGSGHGALAGFLQAQGVDPHLRRHWRRRQNSPGPGGHPAVRRRHRQRRPGCGGFAGGQAGFPAGRAVQPPWGGPRRRPLLRGARLWRARVPRLKRTWERPPLGAAFFCALLPAHAWAVCSSSFPWKGRRGVAFPTQVRERRCMARVQATYSRFRSKSV